MVYFLSFIRILKGFFGAPASDMIAERVFLVLSIRHTTKVRNGSRFPPMTHCMTFHIGACLRQQA